MKSICDSFIGGGSVLFPGGNGYPDPPSDLSDGKSRVGQQRSRFGHPTFDDPLLDSAPGATAHNGG